MIQIVTHWGGSASSWAAPFVKMPGGEWHPQFEEDRLSGDSYTIIADTRNSDELFQIALAVNAIRHTEDNETAPIHLKIGYVPYARQDRVAIPGEALSIEVMADFINMLNFASVTILDPHSDITTALIKRVRVVTQKELLEDLVCVTPGTRRRLEAWEIAAEEYLLVAPDAGAIKKTEKIARELGFRGVVYADKVRDTSTGKILRTELTRLIIGGDTCKLDDMAGAKLLVVDDICDGGRTFTELATCLKEHNPSELGLFVTHGLFTKGVEVLFASGYTKVYTTNSYGLTDYNISNNHMHEEDDTGIPLFRFRAINNI